MKRKIISFFTLICMVALCVCCLVSCEEGSATGKIVKATDTLVVIQVEETDGAATLFDVMETLQKDGELTYTLSGTMLQSLNGKENPADYSSCWMLYTSDSVMGNAEWGAYDYEGTTCLSAIVGGDALRVIEGAYYVWVYKTF